MREKTNTRKLCGRSIDMVSTGKNIKRFAQRRGLSTEDIRAALNLATRQAVYRWYRGETIPNLENLKMLEDLFEVNRLDDIIIFTEAEEC